MMKPTAFALLLALSGACLADGPGSQIRAGPAPTQPIAPVERDSQRCEQLSGEAKHRCLKELRAAMRGQPRSPHEGPGPESTGAGTGAGVGATSGTSSNNFGAAAPR